jgi:hypothetical protein
MVMLLAAAPLLLPNNQMRSNKTATATPTPCQDSTTKRFTENDPDNSFALFTVEKFF